MTSTPLTMGAWTEFNSPLSRRMMERSDVISFHAYDSMAGLEAKLKICRKHGHPVLCTEWMARGMVSRFETHLPFFKRNEIDCYNWGLVAVRTRQTGGGQHLDLEGEGVTRRGR